jgi:hypothetical protein
VPPGDLPGRVGAAVGNNEYLIPWAAIGFDRLEAGGDDRAALQRWTQLLEKHAGIDRGR